MGWWLAFAVFLFLISAALIIAEVFIPSGGILGIFSFLSLAGGVAIFFKHSTVAGITGIIIAVVMIPVVLVLSYRLLPRTRFGKTVLLVPPEVSQGKGIPDRDELNATLGQTGVVLSDLRPVGTVDFLGKRIECVAETGYIPKDVKVRVINVDGSQVTVRQVEET